MRARRLPRHELLHPDGRRILVYGAPPSDSGDGEQGQHHHAPALPAIHKRLDVLTNTWVAISPARNARPLDSLGAACDRDDCPVCPGGAELPFAYDAAVFENRFPSLVVDPPPPPPLDGPAAAAGGRCEIFLYTHRHDAALATLAPLELTRVLAIWRDRTTELWAHRPHKHVLLFENSGSEAGATLAHPHGQIFAIDHVPPFVMARIAAHRRHRRRHGTCLGCTVTAGDARSARVVIANESFVVAVPFAPRWPYEIALRARRHGASRLGDLTPVEELDLGRCLQDVARRYEALFGFPLPHMLVSHEAPRDQPDWHLSFEFLPLHRTATRVKVRASLETATGLFLNDVLPEDAAARLAALEVPAPAIDQDCLFAVVAETARDGGGRRGRPIVSVS